MKLIKLIDILTTNFISAILGGASSGFLVGYFGWKMSKTDAQASLLPFIGGGLAAAAGFVGGVITNTWFKLHQNKNYNLFSTFLSTFILGTAAAYYIATKLYPIKELKPEVGDKDSDIEEAKFSISPQLYCSLIAGAVTGAAVSFLKIQAQRALSLNSNFKPL